MSLAFGAVYAALSLALRIPELPSIVGVMADVLRRPRQVVTSRRSGGDGTASSRRAIRARTCSSSAWAAVKAVNGWTAHRPRWPTADGRGRRPDPRPAARARCPGPSPTRRAVRWRPAGAAPPSRRSRPSSVRRLPQVAGRVSHLRIDPEIEADGPLDRDGEPAPRARARPAGDPRRRSSRTPTRIIDLRADEAALWGDLRKKWRQYVNKARTGGIVVVDAGADRLGEFYRIYRETADRAGFLIRAEAAYRDVWEAFAPERSRPPALRPDRRRRAAADALPRPLRAARRRAVRRHDRGGRRSRAPTTS